MAGLAEAYTQMLIAQADPMNSVIRTMAQQQLSQGSVQLKELEMELDHKRLSFVEQLQSKLDDEIAALERVRDAMDSFASSVAGNFTSNIFGLGGGALSGGQAGGSAALGDWRSAMQAELASRPSDPMDLGT